MVPVHEFFAAGALDGAEFWPHGVLESAEAAEAGLPGFEFDVWYGLVAPALTPPAVIARLYRETSALMEQNALRERFTAAGLEPLGGTPEAFAQRVRLELPKWREVVRTANIRAD